MSKEKGFGALPSLPQRRVVVTGIGLVTPLGSDVPSTWQSLVGGGCGVRALTATDLEVGQTDAAAAAAALSQLPSKVAATVRRGEEDVPRRGRAGTRQVAPFVGYALRAAAEALADARWSPEDVEGRERTGVAIGGGIGCVSDITDAATYVRDQKLRRLSPFFIPSILINMAAGHVSIEHGFMGPNHATVTACASGAHSVGDAARMICQGDADVMLAGGSESCVDALSIAGFCRLKALSTQFNDRPELASRPFDRSRDGFVIGEGAGILVLEDYEHASRRGAKMYAEVRGYGMSGDAHHITQPSADGRGAVLAMMRALKKSGLQLGDIGYINAHATSTPIGDDIEARAIHQVFRQDADPGTLWVSSTKGATGHLLGAAGAVEAAITVLALHHGMLPPTLNLEAPDGNFEACFSLLKASRPASIRAALTNSFGFGGTNASLVFSEPP